MRVNSSSLFLPSFLAQGPSDTNPMFAIASCLLRPASHIDIDVHKHTLHKHRKNNLPSLPICMNAMFISCWLLLVPHIDVDKYTLCNERACLRLAGRIIGHLTLTSTSVPCKTSQHARGPAVLFMTSPIPISFQCWSAGVKQKGKWSSVGK
ncbi:hypothetical protein BDQ17DRAFT_1364560, partial [Cyathus striatus]